MTELLLLQPSLPGDVVRRALGAHILTDGDPPGIIAVDPVAIQCSQCGAVATQPDRRSWQVFLLTSGYGFHICTRGAEGRLCRPCGDAVKAACPTRNRCQR